MKRERCEPVSRVLRSPLLSFTYPILILELTLNLNMPRQVHPYTFSKITILSGHCQLPTQSTTWLDSLCSLSVYSVSIQCGNQLRSQFYGHGNSFYKEQRRSPRIDQTNKDETSSAGLPSGGCGQSQSKTTNWSSRRARQWKPTN